MIRPLLLLLLGMMLAGCATQPSISTAPAPPSHPQWVASLGSARLPKLVDEALANQPGIHAALARFDAARAQASIADAAGLPLLEGVFDGNRSRTNIVGRTSPGSARAVTTNRYSLTVQASWEADLWRRLDDRQAASRADALAVRADLEAARLLLAAQVAKAWFALLEADGQARLAADEVINFRETLKIIRRRYQAGLGDALDLRLARENLSSAQARLALRQQRVDAASRVLETLLGRYPERLLTADETLPQDIAAIPAGLSVQLVQRRPDVRAARQRLFAALHRQADASKNLLPDLRLTASSGGSSTDLKRLLDPDYLIWSIAARLTQPIFNGGRLEAERKLASARRDEALANYGDQLLKAFREIETTLAAEPLLRQQMAHFKDSVKSLRAAERLALSRYKAGLTTITTLLDTERRAYSAQRNLLASQLQWLNNRIDLHVALGGDFDHREDEP